MVLKVCDMTAKVVNFNEYRRARMLEEYAVAILKRDIVEILTRSGFDPLAAMDYLERNRRKNQGIDPSDTNNNPVDPH